MKPIDCQATRQRLEAFHDRELPITDQIAVNGHLEHCEVCRSSFGDLRALRAALLAVTGGRAWLSSEEAAGFTAATVSRLKAEQDASIVASVRLMFEDLHLVYAGLGSAVAALACVAVVLTMIPAATDERPDSLAAMVGFLATPGTTGNPAAINGETQSRWNARFRQANETAEQDAVFALSAVVTRDGRLASLEYLRDARRVDRADVDDAKMIEALLDGLARVRFANEMEGGPAAPARVWLVTRTTVRATKGPAIDLPLPAGKRQAASPSGARSRPVRA